VGVLRGDDLRGAEHVREEGGQGRVDPGDAGTVGIEIAAVGVGYAAAEDTQVLGRDELGRAQGVPGGQADDKICLIEERRGGRLGLVGLAVRATLGGGCNRMGRGGEAGPGACARADDFDGIQAAPGAVLTKQSRRHGAAAGVAGAEKQDGHGGTSYLLIISHFAKKVD